jgi:hypothetical protein
MKRQPTFAALLESFFTQRLMQQRRASAHTIASYRDTFRLLLRFIQTVLRVFVYSHRHSRSRANGCPPRP